MKFSRLIFSILILSALLPAKTRTPAAAAADPNYIFALSVADHFLQAWATHDYETGIVMLTDTAKQGISEDRLDEIFSPDHPVQRAYEVLHGKKLQAGRYVFPVALFEGAGKGRAGSPRYSRVIVIKEAKDEWEVDKLP